MRLATLGGVSALALTLTVTPLAGASAAGSDPNRTQVEQAYAPTPDEWAPQGVLIADSGFDPVIDSFSFPNYANTTDVAQALLGYPPGQPVLNLTAVEAQRIFGSKAACTYGSGEDCVLNPAVAQWVNSVSQSMSGGHCFGMAAVVAGLFNGMISRAGLTPSSVNSTIAFSPAVQRQIAQWYSTQTFFLPDEALMAGAFVPPDEIVGQLVEFLPSGTLPYVLAMWIYTEQDGVETPAGGHGITPYAVYDRGNGLVDIAVYDNNYPLRERAIHVDMNANTWEYEVFATPGQEPLVTGGNAENLRLGLIPLAQLTGRRDCAFCADAAEGTAVVTGEGLFQDIDSVEVSVTDPRGRPVEGVKDQPLLTPSASGFGMTVPTSGDFRVAVRTPGQGKDLQGIYEVSSLAPGEAFNAVVMSSSGGTAGLLLGHGTERAIASTNREAEILQIGVHRDRRLVDYAFTAQLNKASVRRTPLAHPPVYAMSEDGQAVSVTYRGKDPIRLDLAAQRVSPATGGTSVTTDKKGVLVRQGDRITLDISQWRAGEAPELTVTRASGTVSALQTRLVTPEMYEELVSEEQFASLAD